MIGQLFRAIPPLLELGQNELRPGGHHEVLLVDPQEASGLVAVVGVEEAGQAAADVGLVKVDARLRRGGRVLHVEEVQAVGDAAVGPRHGDVPEHGGEVELAEGHGEAAMESRKQAARRPSPPLPRLGSGSSSSMAARSRPSSARRARTSSRMPRKHSRQMSKPLKFTTS